MENLDKILQFENREKKEKFDDLVVFTTTFYKDDEVSKIRAALAEKFFDNVEKLNIKCVVVDGGSSQEFINKIKQYKNISLIIESSLKMGESRRKALEIAMNKIPEGINASFLWVEPEKEDLIKEESLKAMIEFLRGGKADIVVPSRLSKESYPKFQKWIEERANKRAKQLLDKSGEDKLFETELDLWFGPKMFNKEGAKFFLNYKGNLDKWDSIIKPVIEAQRAGKNIVSAPVDFEYSQSQRQQEEGNIEFKIKRVEQYKQILTELGDLHWMSKKEK